MKLRALASTALVSGLVSVGMVGLVVGLGCKADADAGGGGAKVDDKGNAAGAPQAAEGSKVAHNETPRCDVGGLSRADQALRKVALHELPAATGVGVMSACARALPPSYLEFFEQVRGRAPAAGAALSATDPLRTPFEDKACPDSASVLKKVAGSPIAQRRRMLWDECKLAAAGIVGAPAELSPKATLMPYAVHAMLLEHKLDPKIARRVGRSLVALEHEVLQPIAPMVGQKIPRGQAGEPTLGLSPRLFVNRVGMSLRGEGLAYDVPAVVAPAGAKAKRSRDIFGGPPQSQLQLVHPLAAVVEDLQASLPAAAQGFPPLLIVADAQVPAQRLFDVSLVVKEAGFTHYGVAIQSDAGYRMVPLSSGVPGYARGGGELLADPDAEGSATKKEGQGPLHVHLASDGYHLSIGGVDVVGTKVRRGASSPTLPLKAAGSVGQGESAFDIDALRERLLGYAASLDPGTVVRISAGPGVSTQDLVTAFDAARGPKCTGGYAAHCLFELVYFVDGQAFERQRASAAKARLHPALELGSVSTGGGGPAQGGGPRLTPSSEGPQVRGGKPTVRGALHSDVIRRVVRGHLNEVRYCYRTGLEKRPALAGDLIVDFVIASSGEVTAATLKSNTLGESSVGACVAKAVARWKFPDPTQGVVKVSFPFSFRPG